MKTMNMADGSAGFNSSAAAMKSNGFGLKNGNASGLSSSFRSLSFTSASTHGSYNGNKMAENNGNPATVQNGSSNGVPHNSCFLVNGKERKLSNSYLRFQRRYSKHG